MKQRKDPILNEIEKLTWEEYNCFLFFTYCLGLISSYGLNINSENPEALYTPDNREDVLAIIRVGLKDKELEEIIFEFKVNLNLIKKYYDEYKNLCDIDMQLLLADKQIESKLGSSPFVEEDLFNDLRLDFFGEYPNEQHLVEKYILGK